MAESTQLQKKLKMMLTAEKNRDRLSNLPDDIVCHILSFLPTREACRASILSTRWRSLWTMVPALHFFSTSESESEETKELFVRSIDTFLSRRTGQIRKFKLSCDGSCEPHHVQAWISTAIVCNVEQMVLDISLPNITQLPPSLFTCKSLVVLKLQFNICPEFPSFVYLPSLKNFHMSLICSQEIRDDTLPTFLSGCPVLEEFHLAGSLPLRIKISVPTLKKLKLHINSKSFRQGLLELEINTPSLEVLDLYDMFPQKYMVLNLCNVAQANLSIYGSRLAYTKNLFKLLEGLSNVKSLSLAYLTMKYLFGGGIDYKPYMPGIDYKPHLLPEFCNLVYLRVEISEVTLSWDWIASFLQQARMLEVCVIEKKFEINLEKAMNEKSDWKSRWLGDVSWRGPPSIPLCLSSSLKRFEFRGLQNIMAELDFVQYIVKNSRVLEKVKIFATSSNALWIKLCEIQRGSQPLWDIQFKE